MDWRRVNWARIGSTLLAGLWLAGLYFLSILAVAIALTAYQLQHAIRTFESGGQNLTVWEIYQYRGQWNEAYGATQSADARLRAANEQYQKKADELATAEQALGQAGSKRQVAVQRTMRLVIQANPERAEELNDLCCDELEERLIALHSGLPPEKQADSRGVLNDLDTAISEYTQALDSVFALADQSDRALKAVADRQGDVAAANERLAAVIAGIGGDDSERDAVREFLNQLNVLTSIPYLGWIFEFATAAIDLLTLMLVFFMGALGGTIHLTMVFLEGRERHTFGYYIFRPFLGAIIAVTVYIVMRAGVFVIADPAASSSGAQLSPFFISFVAVISGLLAEQALASIQSVGGRWFSSSVSRRPSRWAIAVVGRMAAANKDIKEIRPLLDVDEATITGWLEQREAVPPDAQTTIAAWLGAPIRDLFSDIPPPDDEPVSAT